MVITLTVWQRKKSGGHPTCAGQGRLDDPTVEKFDAAIDTLLGMVETGSMPFQIVATAGDSSRGFQLEQGWSDERIKTELWGHYRNLIGVNG